jgi:hypothetical protein
MIAESEGGCGQDCPDGICIAEAKASIIQWVVTAGSSPADAGAIKKLFFQV